MDTEMIEFLRRFVNWFVEDFRKEKLLKSGPINSGRYAVSYSVPGSAELDRL
jgi:hypothetical protein